MCAGHLQCAEGFDAHFWNAVLAYDQGKYSEAQARLMAAAKGNAPTWRIMMYSKLAHKVMGRIEEEGPDKGAAWMAHLSGLKDRKIGETCLLVMLSQSVKTPPDVEPIIAEAMKGVRDSAWLDYLQYRADFLRLYRRPGKGEAFFVRPGRESPWLIYSREYLDADKKGIMRSFWERTNLLYTAASLNSLHAQLIDRGIDVGTIKESASTLQERASARQNPRFHEMFLFDAIIRSGPDARKANVKAYFSFLHSLDVELPATCADYLEKKQDG